MEKANTIRADAVRLIIEFEDHKLFQQNIWIHASKHIIINTNGEKGRLKKLEWEEVIGSLTNLYCTLNMKTDKALVRCDVQSVSSF